MEAIKAILTRRSTRKFKDKKVEAELVEKIMQAAIHSPSGGNSQNCNFYVIENKDILNDLKDLVKLEFSKMEYDESTYKSIINSITKSKSGDYNFYYDAPLFIIVTNKYDYGNNMADSACALENMMIMANALNLGSVWINQLHWLDKNINIRNYLAKLGINIDEYITGAISIGYPDTLNNEPYRSPKNITGNKITYIK